METVEDRQLRATVSLIEAQAAQIAALRATIDDLEGRLALRAQLDTVIAGEVRAPLAELTDMLATMRWLPKRHPGREDMLAEAVTGALDLAHMVDELLAPDGAPERVVSRSHLVPVPFAAVVEHARAELANRWDAGRVEVTIPDGLTVTTSPVRLATLLVHLMDHACGRSDGTVSVRVVVGPSDTAATTVVAEVVDDGEPVDDDDPFRPGGDRMGLYLARMLARSLGGDVTVVTPDGGGCVARVALPQRRTRDAHPS